jgi:hypothetical protein
MIPGYLIWFYHGRIGRGGGAYAPQKFYGQANPCVIQAKHKSYEKFF